MPSSTPIPKGLFLKDFDYKLTDDKIARYPLNVRDQSKLLVWRNGKIEEGQYANLAHFLPSDSVLVFNNSRVIEARMKFKKPSGGTIELFCLEPHESYRSIPIAMNQTKKVLWICLIGGASKWKKGQVLELNSGELNLKARFVEKRPTDFIIEFSWFPEELTFADILHQLGKIPLPPYLKREAEPADADRYQTIYARESGSVAAPTAGLHFNDTLLNSLSSKGIDSLFLTLHVGAGTFLPVKTENVEKHIMHEEFIEVDEVFLNSLIQKIGNPVIAVGTTSLRALESIYWLGLQVVNNQHIASTSLQLDQNYPYKQQDTPAVKIVLSHLMDWIGRQPEKKLITKTSLFIVPGYRFQIVTGLVTNFHQPHSTLLMLVAALIGNAWKTVYTWALDHDYRFLSYGDGCLFLPH